jgi:multicomponent Na+:H+ antiporter subunit E
MKIKSFLISVVTIFVIWVLLNNKLTLEVLASGGIIAVVVALMFHKSYDIFEALKLSPKAILYWFVYIFVFLTELVKSNLDVAFRVISPKLPINPGIVEVKTKLKSKLGRMILTNSITLTPGTFTVELLGDSIFVHWIDVKSEDIEEDTRLIVRKFEKYLEVIYG